MYSLGMNMQENCIVSLGFNQSIQEIPDNIQGKVVKVSSGAEH